MLCAACSRITAHVKIKQIPNLWLLYITWDVFLPCQLVRSDAKKRWL